MTATARHQPVSGPLTFDSVPELYRTSAAWFGAGDGLSIDFAGVTRVDSAGLALMIEWLRRAQVVPCALRFVNIPDPVLTLVRVNGLQDVILNHPA